MTRPSTPLPPSSACQIALRALSSQGEYGVVTHLAEEHGLRREKVYFLREVARSALEVAFTPSEVSPAACFHLQLGQADLRRAVVALRVITPASVRDIGEVLPVLYGQTWSYGKIWGVLHEAEERARALLDKVDLSQVKNIALDEMFSQGRPVLAGIDLDTQYLFLVKAQSSRSGETWAKSLGKLRDEQDLKPKLVVKDAGTGLASGVQRCWPDIEERDDLFHAVYRLGKEAYHLERGGYRGIRLVEKLEFSRSKAKTEALRRSIGQQIWRAKDKMASAIERYDRFEVLRREAVDVLELTKRGSDTLRTSTEVVAVLTRVADDMRAIGGRRICAEARYLGNRAVGLGLYLDGLAARLADIEEQAGGKAIVGATLRAYQASLQVERGGPAWDRKARTQEIKDAVRHLLNITGRDAERLKTAIGLVLPELANRYRASSAIENLNSVLRPYLVVQKHAENGFLGLFQFYWNTRIRQWGRGKGTSAHEMLTGQKIDDWLTLLGYPPSEARQIAA